MSDDVTNLAERTTSPDESLPIGTLVLAWPGFRSDHPLVTRTRTPVWHVAGIPVVSVEGSAGGIALTHIAVLPDSLDPVYNRLAGAARAHTDAIAAYDELVERVEALAGEWERLAVEEVEEGAGPATAPLEAVALLDRPPRADRPGGHVMSTWSRIDADGKEHALTAAQDKRSRQKFHALMDATSRRADWDPEARDQIDEDPDHLLVGSKRNDGTQVRLIGKATELHGTVCTCCPRRAS